jgi:uncharacterized membrane protein
MPSFENILAKVKPSPAPEGSQILVTTTTGEDKYVAAAAYLYFVSAAILLLRKNNSEFVTFHSRQAFVILLIALLAFVFLPGIWRIVVGLAILTLDLYGAFRALQGQKWNLPYLTQIANSIDI